MEQRLLQVYKAVIIFLLFIALFGVVGEIPTVFASENWTSTGPYGGDTRKIVKDPSNFQILYTVTSGGFFQSKDQGQTWQPINNGLVGVSGAQDLAVDPTNNNRLLVALWGNDNDLYAKLGGVFESLDQGQNWHSVTNTLTQSPYTQNVYTIAIDPTNSQTIYAGVANGVYKSTDNGTTWIPLTQNILYYVHTIVIDPNNPAIIYAGSGSNVYKSQDQGVTWQLLNLPNDGPSGYEPVSLIINPTQSNTLYVTKNSSIYKSIDGGNIFQKIFGEYPDVGYMITFSSTDTNTLYAITQNKLFKTSDGGVTWSSGLELPKNNASDNAYASDITSINSKLLFASRSTLGGDGLYESLDEGQTWATKNIGISAQNIYTVTTDPQNPQIVYAGTGNVNEGSVWKSTDAGSTWQFIHNFGSRTYDIAVDPQNSNKLFVSTNGYGLFKSSDGGQTWSHIDIPGVIGGGTILINPTNPQNVYIVVGAAIVKSTDGGESWTYITTTREITSIIFDPQNTNTLYACGGTSGAGADFMKSTDGGNSWSDTILFPNFYTFGCQVAVDSTNSNVLYIGIDRLVTADGGLWKSTDGGQTWNTITNGLYSSGANGILSLKFNPIDKALYAGTFLGVFKLNTTINTWETIGYNQNQVSDIEITKNSPEKIYLAAGNIYGSGHNTNPDLWGGAGLWQSVSSVPTISSIREEIDQMYKDGRITYLGSSLYTKLSQAQTEIDNGDYANARSILQALINQIRAQIDIHITAEAGNILITQIQSLMNSFP